MDIRLPASKSISARALVINALAEKPCLLQNLSDCDDTRALQAVLAGGSDVGAAGTAMRFATAFLAATPGAERTLTGTSRMLERPIAPLVDALRSLGADIEYMGKEGFPPLCIRGRRLKARPVTIPAHISSQFVSALMMIAPALESSSEGFSITLQYSSQKGEPAKVFPYLEMTRALMAAWGVTSEWRDDHTLFIYMHAYTREEPYVIEPDWSAASYFLAADRTLQFPGLKRPSIQGDSIIVDYLQRLDVLKGHAEDSAGRHEVLELDFTSCPDLAQTMVVASCLADQPFRFTGLETLRIKETDRIAALTAECAKFGWCLSPAEPATLSWDGTCLPPAPQIEVKTYADHRMAMSFALCLRRYPHITFDHPEVVSKSFPQFWTEFHKVLC